MVERSRRRRVVAVGTIGLATGLVLVIAAGLRALPPAADHPLAGTNRAPTPTEQGIPSSLVGLKGGKLVLASTETGEVLRVIVDPSDLGADRPELLEPRLSPDRSTVYFSAVRLRPGGEDRRLFRVPVEGGTPEDLGPGFDPEPNPDGGLLAHRACSTDGCGHALVLRDLRTDEEILVPSREAHLTVAATVWLPDGRLVVELVPAPMNSGAGGYQVIDPSQPPHALAIEQVGWLVYDYHPPTDGIVAVSVGDGRVRFSSVEPDTGVVLGTVARGSWWQVHPAPSGRGLLLLDFRGRVFVSRSGDEPQLIAEGFSEVAW